MVEVGTVLPMVLEHPFQVRAVGLGLLLREQGLDGVLHRSHQGDVDLGAAADLLAADVDLDHRRVLWVELAVGEVGAQHHEGVALLHRVVTRHEPEQAGHPHVEGVVVLDDLLAPHRVHDRCLQGAGKCHDLLVGPGAPGSGQDRHPLGGIEGPGRHVQLPVAGPDDRPGGADRRGGSWPFDVGDQEVTRHDQHRHVAPLERGSNRDLEDVRELRRAGRELAVHTAFAEQLLRVGLLEVRRTDLARGDVGGDRQHGHA